MSGGRSPLLADLTRRDHVRRRLTVSMPVFLGITRRGKVMPGVTSLFAIYFSVRPSVKNDGGYRGLTSRMRNCGSEHALKRRRRWQHDRDARTQGRFQGVVSVTA